MGAAASTLDSTTFALAKAEFESVKDSKTDEELFIHMQKFIESKNVTIKDTPISASNEPSSIPDQVNGDNTQVESSTIDTAAVNEG
jgi:hypothetical protein